MNIESVAICTHAYNLGQTLKGYRVVNFDPLTILTEWCVNDTVNKLKMIVIKHEI